MKRRPLGGTGLEVSELGFGASPLGRLPRGGERRGIEAVHTALELGITFFDVSPYYGETVAETVLGKALRGVDRSAYVLATKVGRYSDTEFDFSAERVTRSVRESLDRLGTDHLDLVQCHDVEFGDLDQVVRETIPALRALQEDGVIGAVGVTGYPLPALAYVVERAPVDTIISYCHYTLQNRRLAAWRDRFARRGTAVINASPLAMGALTNRGAPSWHPAPAEILKCCAEAGALCGARGEELARVALQFAVSTGDFPTTLVGAADPEEVRRNVRWLSEPRDEELLREVEACLEPVRDVSWPNGRPENQNPGGEP
ncbi:MULTISPECIES: aldo/keto reductase [Amycolatopsis]|uniref:L-galactose dehydrogenase n=2 Tax=Amycolatopsis TaxID=1813 RepID=A0A1I3VKU1_9PSEU|nr:aldo/keto reductase [Amycolatopsis sacchari]SFJ94741.1 L-galactose dehydrogenase [Amycolatopsis sacchari]